MKINYIFSSKADNKQTSRPDTIKLSPRSSQFSKQSDSFTTWSPTESVDIDWLNTSVNSLRWGRRGVIMWNNHQLNCHSSPTLLATSQHCEIWGKNFANNLINQISFYLQSLIRLRPRVFLLAAGQCDTDWAPPLSLPPSDLRPPSPARLLPVVTSLHSRHPNPPQPSPAHHNINHSNLKNYKKN